MSKADTLWGNMTDRCRLVIEIANKDSPGRYTHPEDLVMAILKQNNSVAANILNLLGVSYGVFTQRCLEEMFDLGEERQDEPL